ncbi:MAG: pyridoxamine 5'-phosphate oxidase family protein [Sphaerochaetaceae bacterium]|jgi:uncharacterized pyridoxamine 5'-phosphate oxidase family protein|nr:pyridoxamine 5'-phosphate oxidase family protein [Sphaerochaetaceae bacterium]
MKEALEFLKSCGDYYLATVEGDQPRVRPFGTIMMFENRLYIQTGKKKACSRQMAENPKVEICGFREGKWIRITAIAVEDDRREAKVRMLDEYPNLKSMYDPDDGNTQVLWLKDAVATFYSFTDSPRTIRF